MKDLLKIAQGVLDDHVTPNDSSDNRYDFEYAKLCTLLSIARSLKTIEENLNP